MTEQLRTLILDRDLRPTEKLNEFLLNILAKNQNRFKGKNIFFDQSGGFFDQKIGTSHKKKYWNIHARARRNGNSLEFQTRYGFNIELHPTTEGCLQKIKEIPKYWNLYDCIWLPALTETIIGKQGEYKYSFLLFFDQMHFFTSSKENEINEECYSAIDLLLNFDIEADDPIVISKLFGDIILERGTFEVYVYNKN